MEINPTITKTPLGLLVIKRQTFEDDRGFFREPARIKEISEALGEEFDVVQMNHARSTKNILRGIHVAPWNKMIYVPRGKVKSVIVDLRPESANFGKYEEFELGDENRISLFIPKGFGNSYLVLSDEADYIYLTDMEWAPGLEKSVAWNDPEINIDWNVEDPILSDKDKENPSLASFKELLLGENK